MTWHRRRSRLAGVVALGVGAALLVGFGTPGRGFAQVTVIDPPADEAPRLPERFLSLLGRSAAVRYTSGSLDRAHHVLARLDAVASRLNRWTDFPVSSAVYVLDREQWSAAELPGLYGIPLRLGPSAFAVPALGDSGTVGLWRRVLDVETLPLVPGIPLRGTPEEAATLALADVLLQIECGRTLIERGELRPARPWIAELAAHAASLGAIAALEPQRLDEVVATLVRVAQRLGGPGAYSLEEYSPQLLGGDEDQIRHWLWAQGAFAEGAAILVARDGKGTVPRLHKLVRGQGGLDAAVLAGRYPELDAWRSRYLAAPPAP
ncbi:MAG TPA: hypothetical protein VMV46_00840 [Thermoanaerobaculia bacterium]|nr:hypothetical protein [Thermoanaerobaculia bacterium]